MENEGINPWNDCVKRWPLADSSPEKLQEPHSLSLGQGVGHFMSPQQAQHPMGGREDMRTVVWGGHCSKQDPLGLCELEGGDFQAQSPALLIHAHLSDWVMES